MTIQQIITDSLVGKTIRLYVTQYSFGGEYMSVEKTDIYYKTVDRVIESVTMDIGDDDGFYIAIFFSPVSLLSPDGKTRTEDAIGIYYNTKLELV